MTSPLRGFLAALAVLPVMLAGCGSDTESTAGPRLAVQTAKGVIAGLKSKSVAAPVTREQLAAFKQPIIKAEIPKIGLTTYFVPIGRNGDVETWSTSDDKTIALRNGMMIATRGFGPDIMQAAAPSMAQIATGSGSYNRTYLYLDGADQTQRFDYSCVLANLGAETITVVGRQHMTRHIAETCTSNQVEFTNEYWFESGNFVRKSKQLLIPEWGYVTLSRVIDNAS